MPGFSISTVVNFSKNIDKKIDEKKYMNFVESWDDECRAP